jgi:hypothetical protein
MTRVARLSAVLGLLVLVFATASLAAQAPPKHRVTYLTSATAYVDAGSDEGLAAGDRVEVLRAGVVIAVLRVTDVSAHRAACAIESSTAAMAVGDEVRFTPRAEPAGDAPPAGAGAAAVAGDAAAAVPPEEGESWARRAGLRGRIGVRYLGVFDQSGFGGDVAQPSADVRVDGTRVGGSPFDLQVDVRARHTVQTVADGREFNDGEARVYRLNTRWRSPKDAVRVTFGRQFSSALASISTFDGAQAEYDRARWGVGAFAGTQPEPVDYGFSTDVAEGGVYVRLRSEPRSTLRWEAIAAGIGSYEDGFINREYVALLARVMSPRASLMLQQEMDVNRRWKSEAEGSTVSFTNTFVSGRWRATRDLDFDAGYDNRRSARLYRDYVSPETEFDDAYRQGAWGGVGLGFARRYRVGASARSSTGGGAGDARSYTLTASAAHLTSAQVQLRWRSTRYENDRTEGWMHTAAGGFGVGARWMFELFGGVRDEASKAFAAADVSTSWFGADVDVDLGRSLYLNVSGERNGDGDEAYDQVYTGLSWRF